MTYKLAKPNNFFCLLALMTNASKTNLSIPKIHGWDKGHTAYVRDNGSYIEAITTIIKLAQAEAPKKEQDPISNYNFFFPGRRQLENFT